MMENIKYNILNQALNSLNTEEYQMLDCLYLANHRISQRKLAEQNLIPKSTLNNKINAIFEKVRNYFRKNGTN